MLKKSKALVINLAVTAITIIVLTGAAEIGLRLFGNPQFTREHQRLFVQYDPLLGWSKVPNKQARHVTIEYDIMESLNSRGLRGPEYTYDKQPDEYRILILGDSFAEGYSVDFENLCSQVLERQLNVSGSRKYTVINAGTGGYSTDQEYLFFQNEGSKYHPDLTILMFYSNDILSNNLDRHWRGHKPMFRLVDSNLQLTNVPVPKPEPVVSAESEASQTLIDEAKSWLYSHSQLYALVRNGLVSNYHLYRLAIKLGLASVPEGTIEDTFVPEEFAVWSREERPETRSAWEITEALIVSLSRAADSVGSRFMIYYVPISAAVYNKEWEDTQTRYGMSENEWNIRQVASDLKDLCLRHQIDFVDPTDRFIQEARRLDDKERRLYFPRDRHWTAEGHRVCAETIEEHLYGNRQHGSL